MRLRAEISAAAGLFLLCLIPVFLTFLQLARETGEEYRLTLAADSAVDSVFAGYDRELFKRYHLLFLPGSEEEIGSRTTEYLEYYGDPYKGLLWKGGNLLPLRRFEVSLSGFVYGDDENGRVFRQSALNALGYSALQNQVREFLGWREQQRQAEAIRTATWETAAGAEELLTDEESGTVVLESGLWELLMKKLGGLHWSSVKPEGIETSGKMIRSNDLPSGRAAVGEEEEALIEELGFIFYIQKYCSSYTGKKANYDAVQVLDYEQEYILAGYPSDIENIRTVTGELLMLREGLNIISITQDQKKMQIAETIGKAAALLLEIPGIDGAVTSLVVGIWAYQDGLADVRALLAGKKVPFLRGSEESKEKKEGLTYEQYLAVLLFLQNRFERRYRMMDLVECNLQRSNPDFSLSAVVYQLEFQISALGHRDNQLECRKQRYYE